MIEKWETHIGTLGRGMEGNGWPLKEGKLILSKMAGVVREERFDV